MERPTTMRTPPTSPATTHRSASRESTPPPRTPVPPAWRRRGRSPAPRYPPHLLS
jgi:hypothetical protein